MGEMGELGPREERWRRVSHLTGGGHPLTSQSTSVTAPPLTTVPPCSCSCCTTTHTQCCPAEARVGQELVFAGCSLGGVVGSGSGHSLDKWQQPNTSAPPPPPETTHQLHLRPDLGKDLAEEKSNLVLEIFWRGFAFSKTKKPEGFFFK